MASSIWREDPKSVFIKLSRYKFVSKLVQGKESVLEIGCGDGWASSLVKKEVGNLVLSDMDAIWADSILNLYGKEVMFHQIDFSNNWAGETYDAVYALDVLEHINPKDSPRFCSNVARSLSNSGFAIIGMPSLESQLYASEVSKAGHVNCMSGQKLKSHLSDYFTNVFVFSMNDEVVHTGFYGMSHYLIALCVGPKKLE
jgi:2-polyprenyl-3-methyl-5-hydroxy-6-metoxy-1,4-benzoquinol methylase